MVRKYTSRGTPFRANWLMFTEELRQFPKGRAMHKFLNIWVELVRAYPKITVFVLFGLIIVITEWWQTGSFL